MVTKAFDLSTQRLRQADLYEVNNSLVYIGSSWTEEYCLKNKERTVQAYRFEEGEGVG